MNKDTIKTWEYQQMIKFLRKEGIYPYFIKYRMGNTERTVRFINRTFTNISYFSDFIIRLDSLGVLNHKPIKNVLLLSQLWRFFILEQYDKINLEKDKRHFFDVDALNRRIINAIRANGTRCDETLSELFKKYKLDE